MNNFSILLLLCLMIIALKMSLEAKVTALVLNDLSTDPKFEISENEFNELTKQKDFSSVKFVSFYEFEKLYSESSLGYFGFLVEMTDSKHTTKKIFVRGAPLCESYLLNLFVSKNKNSNSVRINRIIDHISESIHKKFVLKNNRHITTEHMNKIQPNVYIVGPDNVTNFTPEKWNDDRQILYHNNCYNYGNDIRTDTFAQPGRGSGHKWDNNTCPDVIYVAQKDGLILYSLTDPPKWEEKPDRGHFIALVMWPDVNFHWYKKDLSNYWSHKPGQTPARNYDNSGKKIEDPAKCDRGPYTQFCSYFVSVPSQMKIN